MGRNGPRRERKMRSLLTAKTFGASRDFFDVPLPALPKAEASNAPATVGPPSPRSLKFLDSFHTGLTPPARKQRRAILDSCAQQGARYKSLLGVDCSWQPRGLDSFLYESKARREKLGTWSASKAGATRHSSGDVAHAAAVRRGAMAKAALSRIPALLEQVHVHAKASESASDDDEEAPVATVPVMLWGG